MSATRREFLAGAALPDMPEFELWLLGERTRLHEYYERGLSELIARLIAVARYADAIARAQQLVQANPLLEQAHARLIWLYAQTGQRHAAPGVVPVGGLRDRAAVADQPRRTAGRVPAGR